VRVFFALWPDTAVREALARLASRTLAASRAGVVRPENLHATVVFVGEVAPERRQELCAAARALRPDAFELILDHVGYWRHNRVVFAGTSTPPGVLIEFAARLADALRRAGCPIERRAFVPHVTLARNARDPGPITLEPVVWRPRELALIESQRDGGKVVYQPVDCWTLAASAGYPEPGSRG